MSNKNLYDKYDKKFLSHDKNYFRYFIRDGKWHEFEYELRAILVMTLLESKNLILGYDYLEIEDIDYLTKNHRLLEEILKCSTVEEIDVKCAMNGIESFDWRLAIGLIILEPMTSKIRNKSRNLDFFGDIANSTALFDEALKNSRFVKVLETIQMVLEGHVMLKIVQMSINTFLSMTYAKNLLLNCKI